MPTPFHVMVKPRGAICNLSCAYCFYLPKVMLYPQGSFRMPPALLETYTRQYIESQPTPEITFAWQGGEPTLMGLDFFRQAVALQRQYQKPGTRILNALQTNATLLDDEWAAFFKENEFLVGLSLDGPRHLHDAYRVDKGGQPTFERVMKGLRLLQKHAVEVNVLACVNSHTARRPLEVYHFLRDQARAQFIQFIPIVERVASPGGEIGASTRSVSGLDFGRFLVAIFDEWVRRDVGRVYIQHFDMSLAAWAGARPGSCAHEATCGQALALEHNGDLYACDHFVDSPHYLGNIQERPLAELADLPQQRRFGLTKRESLPPACLACSVRFVCNGGCPKDRLLPAAPGEPPLNHLCTGYRMFFNHIARPMQLMAALLASQRTPAEIMNMLPPAESRGRRRH